MRGITGGVNVEASAPSTVAEAASKHVVQRILEAGILRSSRPTTSVSESNASNHEVVVKRIRRTKSFEIQEIVRKEV